MRQTIAKFRARQTRSAVALADLIRRVTVTLTAASGVWQLLGVKGDTADEDEIFPDVENFSGVGFASRPKPDGKAEAIVAHYRGHPVIIATRDKSILISLDEDETAIFNSQSRVKIRKDGGIEAVGSQVELGASGLGMTDGLVHGSGTDTASGLPYWMLGSASSVVKGVK